MFDNLRQQSLENVEETPTVTPTSESKPFLGLTPVQRFVLALMLFLNVTVLGCFALIAFEKIVLPF
jgi:hypothetical protein